MPRWKHRFRDEIERATAAVTSLAPLVRRRQKAARRACDELLAASPERRRRLIQDGRATRMRCRPVVEELIRRLREEVFRNPRRAEELGLLTASLLLWLPPSPEGSGGKTGLADLHARLWAHRGNVARVRCRWQEAYDRFQSAYPCLEQGSGDALLEAEVLRLHASLYLDRRQHESALDCLWRAEETYLRLEEPLLRGKVLLNKSAVLRNLGCSVEALGVHLEACKLLEDFEQPELGAAAWNNLIVHLCDLGKPRQAANILRDSEPLFQLCARDSAVRIYRAWAKARVAALLGEPRKAEDLYLRAKLAFARLENPYDAALVSFDLATLYAEAGRVEDLAAIAEETYASLREQELNPEAAQALELFVTAARRRQVAVDLIRAAARRLREPASCKVG